MDLDPQSEIVNDKTKNSTLKQTTITNTFKERKRKCSDSNITQSKEKKKRNSDPISTFQCLRESFGKTSTIMKDLERTKNISNEKLEDFNEFYEPIGVFKEVSDSHVKPIESIDEQPIQNDNTNFNDLSHGVIPLSMDDCNDQFDEINDIIREIESERTYGSKPNQSRHLRYSQNITSVESSQNQNTKATESSKDTTFKRPNTTQLNKKCTKNVLPAKSNYNFIDLLERNVDLNDDEEKDQSTIEQSGFSLNIKQYIDKYLNQVQKLNKVPDQELTELIETTNKNTNETINSECTDNSELPEYVELSKVKTLPIIIEQDELIGNSPNNIDTFSQIQKVIKTLEPNEQLKSQDPIQNYADITELQRCHDLENNLSVLITERNVKNYREMSNTEATVNDRNTEIEPQNQNESPTYTEINFANSCYLTNDMPHNMNNVSHKNEDRQTSTLECAKRMKINNNVSNMLEYNDFNKISNSSTYMQDSDRNIIDFEENNTNTTDFRLFNKDLILMDIDDEQLKAKPDKIDHAKCLLVSQLVDKTKSFTLEDSHQILPISTEENTQNQICTDNILCNKTTRTSNDGFTELQQKNRREYVKKYSYTSGQTNVITKVTNDSIVRITRKLQLNLDITEILQKDTNSKDSHNISTIIVVPEKGADIDDLTTITNINFVNDHFNKTAPQPNFNDKSYSYDLTTKSNCPITYPRYILGENVKEIVTKHSSPINSSNAIIDTITAQDFELEFKDNNSIKERKNENNCDQIVLSKSTKENSTNENKDINNILHKYSEIMR